MSIYALLDGQPVSAYTVEDTWVEFETIFILFIILMLMIIKSY